MSYWTYINGTITVIDERFDNFYLLDQPTAYDIDGVVEQLKRCYETVRSTSVDYAEDLKDAYEKAIGIVKAGGTCR